MIPSVTMTGVDERTDINAIKRLLERGVEIGVLLSLTPEGRNRYPSQDWIWTVVPTLHGRLSLHVCGRAARTALLSRCAAPLDKFSRIQINGSVDRLQLLAACQCFPNHEIITQWRGDDSNELLPVGAATNHSLLVDASGGRGETPATWTRPDTTKRVGFAGGLGPDTLSAELPKIAAVATGDWWIDMENQLRTDDWFDPYKAFAVLDVLETMRA